MRRGFRLFIAVNLIISTFFPLTLSTAYAQTPTTDISATVEFSPQTIAQQGVARMTITINNANSLSLTSLAMTNTFPAGLSVSDPASLNSTCGGTTTADPTDTEIVLSGGTIAGNGSCEIAVNVESSVSGNLTNTINAGDITGDIDSTFSSNQDAAFAVLNIATFDFNAEINKSFNPINISPGDISRLSVSIYNSNTFGLENASWSDDLEGVQSGLYIADTPNVSTTDCGPGVVTAIPGTTTLSLSGATVPAKVGSINGECRVQVDVSSVTPGNLINTIPGEELTANEAGNPGTTISNTDPASATLNVDTITVPSISKNFSPSTIWTGQTSQLTVVVRNNDLTHDIDTVSLTDNLPSNVYLDDPVSPSLVACGSSASIIGNPGDTSFTLNNAEIAANSTCTYRVNVVSDTQGEYTNTIPADAITSRQGVTNAAIAQDDLHVQAIDIQKSFSPTSINAGDISTLTITIYNPTGSDFTGATIDDVLPGSVIYFVDSGTSGASDPATTCGAGSVVIGTTNRTDDTISLTGGVVPAGSPTTPGTCTITASVSSDSASLDGRHTNTIDAGDLTTDQGISNPYGDSAYLDINALSIDVHKDFYPNSFQEGGSSTLTITVSNPTNNIVHITDLTDALPSGLVTVGTPGSTTCTNGQVIDNSTSITLTGLDANGAEVPAGTLSTPGTCSFSIAVTAASSGSYNNTIPANTIVSVEGLTNLNSDSESITAYTTGYGLSGNKAFVPNLIIAGDNSYVRIRLTAPDDRNINNLAFTDTLPANVVVSNQNNSGSTVNPSLIGSCGDGTVTATTGAGSFDVSGVDITASQQCEIRVYVTSDVPGGPYTNTIVNTSITNDEGQITPDNFSANLTVTDMEIHKAFYPDTVAPNGITRMTITIENHNPLALTSLSLTDNLNTMGTGLFTVANPANAETTCSGGSVTASPGSNTVSLSGGVVPAEVGSVSGICTVSVDVIASGTFSTLPTTRTNTVYRTGVSALVGSTTINPIANASASVTVTPLTLGVVKGFNPLTVFGGSSSTMSVQLINPNSTVLTNISFTDTMPTGMYLAAPTNFNTGTCGGTITGSPGDQSFSFSGGTLAAGKRCTLTLSATMNVHGNRTNTIPADGVTSANGASNPQPASASLTNLPGASITKFFTPDEITLGETSLMTIQIKNTGNIALSNMGLTDNLPGGMVIAASPAATNACGGIVTATPGTSVIQLGAGSIIAGPDTTCDIVVPVTVNSAGIYNNFIAKNSLTTSEGATNTEPAEDDLTVNASPSLQLVKSFIPGTPPYTEPDTLNYSLVATNTGDITLHNVTISDPGVTLGTCTPTLGSPLDPGDSMTCPASHDVTETDEIAGSYTNTATANSDEAGPETDSVTVPIGVGPALSVSKSVTTAGPYELGDTVTYNITATNTGTEDLHNVIISDPGTDVVMGSCTPSQPATLTVGNSMECSATHVVSQADVDAETFSNTATGNSDETGPESDTVTIPIVDNAELNIDKQVVSSGPYNYVGAVITYDISAINSGEQTLTNVTISDPTPGVSLGACTPSQPATLATGEILSCAATHTVDSTDLANGGFTNTAYADSDQTDQVSDTEEVVTQTPTIQLEKTGTVDMTVTGSPTVANAGDVINYVFTVTNTGEVTLTNIDVSDLVGGVTISGGPLASLDAGDSDNTTFSGSYTLTQADIDAGTFTNTASVTGEPPVGNTVSDLDDDTQTLTAVPAVEIVKSGVLHIDTVSPGSRVDVGDTITYSFTVTNTGNVTLTNVTVTDPDATISGGPIASMDPGDSDTTTFTGTYTLTQADVDAGTFTNTATVAGTPPTGDDVEDTDSDTQTLPADGSMTLVKSGSQNFGGDGRIDAGDTITYTFAIENTGNVTLNNILITDAPLTVTGGPITLAPGATDNTSITATYTVTQADIDACHYENTAFLNGNIPTGVAINQIEDTFDADFTTVPTIDLAISPTLDTTVAGDAADADAGDVINYSYTITNTGNVTLTNIDLTQITGNVSLNGSAIASLAPGASDTTTFTGSHTLTQAEVDAGSFANEVRVDSTAPACTLATPTETETETTTLSPNPSVTLEKTGVIDSNIVAPNGQADPGDEINYSFTVTNTGNVTLTNLDLVDGVAGVILSGGPIASLAPGAVDSTTYTGSYTLIQADIDAGSFYNDADITGDSPGNTDDVTDDDDDTRNLGDEPFIGVAKRVVDDPEEQTPGVWNVTFEIYVRNYGNVTLTNVQVADDIEAMFGIDPFSIISLTSSDFTVNSAYDGLTAGDTNLLDGTDSLAFEEDGTITLVIQVTPSSGGPFENTAVGTGTPPSGPDVTDDSHDGVNPDEDGDNNPTNDNTPTPVDFGPNLFDPPHGRKTYDANGLPLLHWTMVWINDTNIVAIDAAVNDPIPEGTTYSGGLVCTPEGSSTTSSCYFEPASATYPRGRIVWTGSIGPDLGVTDPALAVNEVIIEFDVIVNGGVREVRNEATIGADLNGDGVITGTEEEIVDTASDTWSNWPTLPLTGFAPNRLNIQDESLKTVYDSVDDLTLDIAELGIEEAAIVGVPIEHGEWNLEWLGNNVGYLSGTAYPTWSGNSALTAHNYDANGRPSLFIDLEDLKWGDEVVIHGWGTKYIYEVRTVRNWVKPDNSDIISHEEKPWITLITCHGYDEESDTYRWRTVVRAVLVRTEAE